MYKHVYVYCHVHEEVPTRRETHRQEARREIRKQIGRDRLQSRKGRRHLSQEREREREMHEDHVNQRQQQEVQEEEEGAVGVSGAPSYYVDIARLAEKYPAILERFVKRVRGKEAVVVDWRDGDAVRALAEATLLEWCPGLSWWRIPKNCLCPAVPQRRAYIDWIHALLRGSSPSSCNAEKKEDDGREDTNASTTDGIRGLDVGTGASLVYPLLGCSMYGWHFVATDILPPALENAREILRRNDAVLAGRISVRDVRFRSGSGNENKSRTSEKDGDAIIEGVIGDAERFHFSMCNPPFFADVAEARRPPGSEVSGFFSGERNPNTCHGGLDAELVTRGGEEAFVEQMVLESFRTRHRVRWYTTLFGKKSTMVTINAMLRRKADEERVTCVRTGVLALGKIRRWVIAWSFSHVSSVPCLIRDRKKEQRLRRKRKRISSSAHSDNPNATSSPISQPIQCATDTVT